MKTKLILFMCIILTGCAHSPRDMNRISLGMTKEQVIDRLGEPHSTSAKAPYVLYTYEMKQLEDNPAILHFITFGLTLLDSKKSLYGVKFKDGRVNSYGPIEEVSLGVETEKGMEERKPSSVTNNINIGTVNDNKN